MGSPCFNSQSPFPAEGRKPFSHYFAIIYPLQFTSPVVFIDINQIWETLISFPVLRIPEINCPAQVWNVFEIRLYSYQQLFLKFQKFTRKTSTWKCCFQKVRGYLITFVVFKQIIYFFPICYFQTVKSLSKVSQVCR